MSEKQQGLDRSARSRARRQALQILYQSEVSADPAARILAERTYSTVEVELPAEEGADEVFHDDIPLEDYAATLALGVEEHLDHIDALLDGASRNWKLWRMPVVDLNILRIAVYEILYNDEVPVPVAINEAVELARAFAGDESTKFVNGVLGGIAKRIEEEKAMSLPTFDASALPGDEPLSGKEIPSGE